MRLTSPALALLPLLVSVSECNWRRPLPRGKDAGPPVEVVDSRPNPITSNGSSGSGQLGRPALPAVDEHEPNDDREHAQPIETGKAVRGSLAPPTTLGAGKGADDWYAVTVGAAPTPQLLRIEASGSAHTDLALELYDPARTGAAAAQPFARLDEHGRGEPEHLSLAVQPRQVLLVRVRGSVAAGGTEPLASTYQLQVNQSPAPPGSEAEPNDAPEQATPATAEDLTGTLPWRGDEDFWVINVADALYRRPTTPDSAANPPGLKAPAILRIELRTPGATPAMRLLIEPASDAAQADGGAAPGGFRKLQFAFELTAPKGSQELRLRNVGLPAGTARAFVGVRTLAPAVAKGAADPRYQLRLGVEPQLEDAESEPNDDCAQASEPVLSASAGGSSEGSLAGFLWPGDSDCFRIRAAAAPRRHTVQLILPGTGSDCRAALEWVRSDGVERVTTPADGGSGMLQLKARGDALIRVSSRDHKTCFDAPYRLLVRSEPERP